MLKVTSILLLEGEKIFKYNEQMDQIAKQMCREKDIQIIEKQSVRKVNT